MLLIQSAQTQAAPPSGITEYQLKAAYLIHLSEFTTWPEAKMAQETFNICLAKGSTLTEPLTEIEDRHVKEKPLRLIFDVPPEQLSRCHVLYVEESLNKKTFQQSLQKNDAILTVSDEDGFVKKNGIVEYYPVADKIKMRGNFKMMKQSQLTISPKLLQLMDIDF